MEPVERLASELLTEGVMQVGEWIEHDGKGMPLSGDTFVLCRFNDGSEEDRCDFDFTDQASYWNDEKDIANAWIRNDSGLFITAYRIVNP